ncbi:MAG TPA: hypothetical protein VK595_07630 [Vicinamibacterales bacterium]|nr:hypothetical protein [Vicinamibacterales bacterium]
MSADPTHSDGDEVLAALDEVERDGAEVCEHAGHEWCAAGGGLLICATCTAEKWEDERG